MFQDGGSEATDQGISEQNLGFGLQFNAGRPWAMFPSKELILVARRCVSGVGWMNAVALGLSLMVVAIMGCRRGARGQTEGDHASSHTNALIHSNSPYLLQHAHNPVNWMPWGPEAFEMARREDKPIFVSIGYSTCYWCHVMERESFEDEEVARAMNENYVCIKVDREQRPDIDEQLMMATQLITGRGGWPNSVWLTPDGRPFMAGTYFPRPQFLRALRELARIWREERSAAEKQADALSEAIRQVADWPAGDLPAESIDPLDRALAEYARLFDAEHGGFGGRPKFPPHGALLILAHAARQGDREALRMLDVTLESMWCGGIHDHVGGGFHRYSTDERWLLPHFEKMLYDNAQLVRAYAEAYALTEAPLYRTAVQDVFDWMHREMLSPDGGFYSALDSISPGGGEGEYYTWPLADIEEVLGVGLGGYFASTYHFDPRGNYLEESTGHRTGRNIPYLVRDQLDLAADGRLAEAREKLLERRQQRPAPARDDKILAGWNGLMVAGLARAGQVLEDPAYVESAERAAGFLMDHMRDDQGRLLRSWRKGKASILGYLDDYAYTIDGLVRLHAATGQTRWLTAAIELTDRAIDLFGDEQAGGFYFSSTLHEKLLLRAKRSSGGGNLPDPNGVMAQVLVQLSAHPEVDAQRRAQYAAWADRTIESFRPVWARNPRQVEHLVLAFAMRAAGNRPPAEALPPQRFQNAVLAARLEPVSIRKSDNGRVQSVRLRLHLDIAGDFHLYAADGSEEASIVQPLAVSLANSPGWKLIGVEFPPGQRQVDAILQREVVRYRGGIDIWVRVAPVGQPTGERPPISIQVQYQACDATRCLAPTRFTLTAPAAP